MPQGYVFLQHDAVHGLRLLQAELYVGSRHPVGRGPICVPRVVGHGLCRELLATRAGDLGRHACHDVVAQLALYYLVEGHGVGRVDRVDQPVAVHGEVEQEGGVVAHAAIVEVGQLLRRLHLVVLLGVVEPSRANGHVALRRRPLVAVGVAILQLRVFGIAWIHLALAQESPVGLSGHSLLVAHPSASGSAVAEDHGLRLQAVEHLEDARVVVIVFAVYGAPVLCAAIVAVAAVGTVEPHLEHLAVVGHEVAQLGVEIRQVLRRGILGARAVPRREVDGEPQPVFLARVGHLAHNVALAVAPWRAAHVVVVAGEGPQAEAIVVLGREYDALHAGAHESARPLLTVETLGVEGLGVGVTIAPLAVVERVEAEMYEGIGLHLLPVHLLLLG